MSLSQQKPAVKQQQSPPQHHNPTWRQNSSAKQRPPLVLGFPSGRGTSRVEDANEVQVKNAFRHDNSVIIQWDSGTTNILGFRVVYRLFADKSFKQGPPLEASEREFKIKNVPSQECIVVCVISLEELNVTPESVPYSQCREVRTLSSPTSNMDKITIAASAAICGTIIVAVIIFIAAGRYVYCRIIQSKFPILNSNLFILNVSKKYLLQTTIAQDAIVESTKESATYCRFACQLLWTSRQSWTIGLDCNTIRIQSSQGNENRFI